MNLNMICSQYTVLNNGHDFNCSQNLRLIFDHWNRPETPACHEHFLVYQEIKHRFGLLMRSQSHDFGWSRVTRDTSLSLCSANQSQRPGIPPVSWWGTQSKLTDAPSGDALHRRCLQNKACQDLHPPTLMRGSAFELNVFVVGGKIQRITFRRMNKAPFVLQKSRERNSVATSDISL